MLSDLFGDEGPQSALTKDAPAVDTAAYAPAPSMAPTPAPKAAATDATANPFAPVSVGGGMNTPVTPTPVLAPGIPENPFGGVGGMTGDPLAFAPYTPPAPSAPATPAPASPSAGMGPSAPERGAGDAQYAPDTSGFPGGDLGAATPMMGNMGPTDVGEAAPSSPFATLAGAGTSTYQAPAYIPPDLSTTAGPAPPAIQPLEGSAAAQNAPGPIAPTFAPVPVSQSGPTTVENPPAPATPTPSPIEAPTVLPNVPTTTPTGTGATLTGPEGTPTPAAALPNAGLPIAAPASSTLTAMTGTMGGTPEQGTVPPVSVNGLLNQATGPVGGGESTPTATSTQPITPATVAQPPVTTPPIAAPPGSMLTATAPVSVSQAAPSTLQATGLGGNPVAPLSATSIPTAGTAYAPALTPVTPETALTNQQISVAPTADRFALAQQKFSDFANQSNPAYQAALREATQRSAAAGGLGSGMLRTAYGNAELARENALNTARNQFLTEALQGTIGDAYQNAQLAAQQQGFQNQQQQQAFTQALMQQELANAMQQQGFNQAQQQLAAGSSGSPAEMGMLLSQIFGQQATGSANAAGQIAAGIQAQQNADRQYQTMLAYLAGQGIDVSKLQGGQGYGTPQATMNTLPPWLQAIVGTTSSATPTQSTIPLQTGLSGLGQMPMTYPNIPTPNSTTAPTSSGATTLPSDMQNWWFNQWQVPETPEQAPFDQATAYDANIDPQTGRPWFMGGNG